MSLQVKVFAANVSCLSDARYFAGMGVSYIGIQANPTMSGYLSPEHFRQIAGWISGPVFVLQVAGLTKDQIESVKVDYGIELIMIAINQIGFYPIVDEKYFLESDSDKPEFLGLSKISVRPLGIVIAMNEVNALQNDQITLAESITGQIFLANIYNAAHAKNYISLSPKIGFAVSGTPEAVVGLKEYNFRDFMESLDMD